jgi:hypothetical protein
MANCIKMQRLPDPTPMIMKTRHYTLLLAVSLTALAAQTHAQTGRVWRCGNEYTNDATVAQQRGCKVMEGGNVTVVQTPRSTVASSRSSSSAASSPAGMRARCLSPSCASPKPSRPSC